MKKLNVVFSVIFGLIVISCQTSGSIVSSDGFKTSVDDVRGITFITHKDMEIGSFYNLRDSMTGERENISLYISGTDLIASAEYQGSDWIFISGIVFLDDSGNRLAIEYGSRTDSKVRTGAVGNVYVREHYGAILKSNDISKLENILNSGKVYVAFLGKRTTEKMELKQKYKSAMIATIEKKATLN
ncbi:MAG: hypothetical protein IKP60_14115 [Treponema sp.]|nr:hypothetical protein [Treponema sp.]